MPKTCTARLPTTKLSTPKSSSRTPSNLWEKVMGSFNSTTPCSVSFQLRVTTAPSNWEKDNKIRPMAPTVFSLQCHGTPTPIRGDLRLYPAPRWNPKPIQDSGISSLACRIFMLLSHDPLPLVWEFLLPNLGTLNDVWIYGSTASQSLSLWSRDPLRVAPTYFESEPLEID